MLPALYAHRLGRSYGPDSSAAALTRALERPLDGLETDCCLTADGEQAAPGSAQRRPPQAARATSSPSG